ncbi:uncharacterized protein LOC127260488 [Andrographis paniculata]|uniref:uncharacterized protein LOC127260488 n=1 Tax=Andrographis paniculata TaxID=175694 RepID=UPI0021E8DC2B|nr:uncharacterized protein LOC127260488 [Andrographis paniculata]
MEQFRQIGEAVGSMKALMVFSDNLLNQRQCSLMVDMANSAYNTIAHLIKHNLRFDEKNTKWKIIENPLKELLRIFKEAESILKHSLDAKNWWAKALAVSRNDDCVELHVHNFLTYFPIAVEAVELAGQISDDNAHKKNLYSIKYRKDFKDPKTFQSLFGNHYLVSLDFCRRIESALDDDRWFLLKKIRDKKKNSSNRDRRLADLISSYLGSGRTNDDDMMLPSSILLNSKDYSVRKRVGSGSNDKEIQWLGESFLMRQFNGEFEQLIPDIRNDITLCHPNILQTICAFSGEEKRECFLLMELTSRDLSSYVKETSRKRGPLTLPVAVDVMLQIARGMEYLHSKNVYHGELNPSNVFVKSRGEVYVHAKVSGFGASSYYSRANATNNNNGQIPFIWYAPEVLADQEQSGGFKGNEKCDVYSFGMICFEVLTGKVPFEDAHLQGDKMSRNVRAGERPLFPFHSPKFITNLTKKCWHNDPGQRPNFASICRILRHVKRFLVMNPECSQPDSPAPIPPVDFQEIEAGVWRSLGSSMMSGVTQIPFQMFAYRVTEREKANAWDCSESGSDGDENALPVAEELFSPPPERPEIAPRKLSLPGNLPGKAKTKAKTSTQPGYYITFLSRNRSFYYMFLVRHGCKIGIDAKSPWTTPKGRGRGVRSVRPPAAGQTAMRKSESQLTFTSSRPRRKSGHVSDSELT